MPPTKRPKPTTVVLGLLCVMYLITYVDRVNISTAADSIKRELALSNSQLGFLQSAFGYPYLVFQIFGGWIGDRFGPRRTLFLCGLIWAAATILTGFSGGVVDAVRLPRAGRRRRRRDVSRSRRARCRAGRRSGAAASRRG